MRQQHVVNGKSNSNNNGNHNRHTHTPTHTHQNTHSQRDIYLYLQPHWWLFFQPNLTRLEVFFTNQNLFLKLVPTQPIVPSGLCPSYSSSTSSSTLSLCPFLQSSLFSLSLWPVPLPTPSLLSHNKYIEPTSLFLFLLPVNCNCLCLSLSLYLPILI